MSESPFVREPLGSHTTEMLFSNLTAVPPEIAILQLSTSHWLSQAVAVATRYGIPDLLAHGAQTADELAAATATQPGSLYRLLRLLAGFGIFHEDKDGYFSLTAFSEKLCTGVAGSMRDWVLFNGEPWRLNMLSHLGQLVQNGQTIYEHLYQSSIFDYFTANPTIGDFFNRGLQCWSLQAHTAAVAAYDFSGMHTVIDVGGGYGNFLALILRANPALRGILFDTPTVAEGARQHLQSTDIAPRCDIMAGDFFVAVPEGGDAYILSTVLNDWTDEQCIAILSNCRQVMHSEARLLIVEAMIGPRNEPAFGKIMDIAMLLETTGRVRTEAEFEHLLERAGFQVTQIIHTPAPSVNIIESRRVD